jgi:hypothetical protein
MLAVPTCFRIIKAYFEDLINEAKRSLLKPYAFMRRKQKKVCIQVK